MQELSKRKRSSTKFSFGRRDGQAVILVVVAMSLFLIGALGLAIDGGQMYAQRQMAQAAADAAAQAGSLSIMNGTNITSAHPFGTGSNPASYTCTTTDGITPCVYARNNGFGGTTADTVILSYPATVAGVTLMSSAAVPGFAVSVQRTLQTGLIRLVGGPATSSITAKATAGIVGAVSPYCVYVLDPSSADAFSATGGYTMKANGCAIAVNSSSSQAVSITGGFAVTTTKFNDVGGVILTNGGSSTPAVTTGATKVNNPLASLPTLTPGSCSTHPTMFSPSSGSTLQPGTYCGGISVGGGASVTFAAGQYIINGGGIGFGGGSSATGSQVLFYLTGTNTLGVSASGAATTYESVDIGNSVNVTLSAPTSGVYQGILFFQDPSITLRTTGGTNYATFDGGANMKLSGTLYFPTTQVLFDNGVTAALSAAIVAWQLTIDASATFTYDSTGTKTGLFSQSVALVQ